MLSKFKKKVLQFQTQMCGSPALGFIFAAPFWVILLGKVPANDKRALIIIIIMTMIIIIKIIIIIIMGEKDSGYNHKCLLRHKLDLNRKIETISPL